MSPFTQKTSKKRLSIKDPVWGVIELFPWEKELLNEKFFNRLHNVVQISSGFRVYPGLRHSRFLHSIGVLHVATQMFINAVKNTENSSGSASGDDAPPGAWKQFLLENEKLTTPFKEGIPQGEIDDFFDHAKLSNISKEYFVTFCVLRIGALLHDIGHLPYSHILETAILASLDDQGSKTKSKKITAAQIAIKKIVDAAGGAGSVKIHEKIGEKICLLLEYRSFSAHVMKYLIRSARNILHTEDFPLLSSLLVGDVDADRIDYVRRDGYFSGLYTSSVDYERLFFSYGFAKYTVMENEGGKKEKFLAIPSSSAMAEAEKLIFERFLFYQKVVSHHRVHLFDEIMVRIVRILIKAGDLEDFFKSVSDIFTLDESDLKSHSHSDTSRINKIIENLKYFFDDSWLDCQIRAAHRKSLVKWENGGGDIPDLVFLCDATYEDRRLLRGLHKGGENAKCRTEICDPTFGYMLSDCKFDLEKKVLEKFQKNIKFIIIGDMQHRLSVGIKSERMATYFGLGQLRVFLRGKLSKTPLFNAWYSLSKEYQAGLDKENSEEYSRKKLETLRSEIELFCIDYVRKQQSLPLVLT